MSEFSAEKKKNDLSILEAVDYISRLTESAEEKDFSEKKIRTAFESLNAYLHHLYQKERDSLKDLSTQIGIQALMQLAQEAAEKVEKFTTLFKGLTHTGSEILEYQKLQQFYKSKVITRLKKGEGEETSSIILGEESEIALDKQALKDLEGVRSDKAYELFYIHQKDGMPFFSENLARHIRLVGRFDKSLQLSEGEDLLTRMTVALDRDYHESAREMLARLDDHLRSFYKEALKYKHIGIVAALNKAFMSLMLAANPKNLKHNTDSLKTCLHYFIDFQRYLREALTSDEYFQFLYVEKEKETPFFLHTKELSQLLCSLLMLREGDQEEGIELVRHLFKREEIKFSTLWGTLKAIDERIRQELLNYPSGPLLSTLSFLDEGKLGEGFDPILQKNAPCQLFTISSEMLHTTFLHLPSPTKQELIDKAHIVPEFLGYLHYLHDKKHLLINLQDCTSWEDFARCQELEEVAREVKFESVFHMLTFPKNTDFYHQQNEYKDINEASAFKELVKEQIMSGKQCGFYFPKGSNFQEQILPFIDFIHVYFFDKKEMLTKQDRLNFIEIFYFFSFLLIIEKTTPDSVSFTCKDGVDIGSTSTASFFGFARLLSTSSAWTENEKEFFLFSFYKPAAFVRQRAPSFQRVERALSALEYFETVLKAQRDTILKSCAALFPDLPLHKFVINKVA